MLRNKINRRTLQPIGLYSGLIFSPNIHLKFRKMLLPLLDLVEAAMIVLVIDFIVKSQTKKLDFGPKSAIQGFGIRFSLQLV